MRALALLLALVFLAPAAAPAEAAAKKPKCAVAKKAKKKPRRKCRKPRLSSRSSTLLLGAPGGFSTPAPFATAVPPAPVAGTPAPATPDAPDDPPVLPPVYSNPRAVQVRATEWHLQLSKPSVLGGDVRVEFNSSRAEDPHDLRLLRGSTLHSFDEQGPGAVATRTLSLAPGNWKLFCSLPEHEERGMVATLQVSAG